MALFSKKKKSLGSAERILSQSASASATNSYLELRTNLIFSIPWKKCKKILVTSASENEVKNAVAVNIAKIMSEGGDKALLMDCDFRSSDISHLINLEKSPGVSDALVYLLKFDDVIHHYAPNVDVVTSGTAVPNPGDLLDTKDMEQIIKSFEERYDYIIINAAAGRFVNEAAVLSKYVDGVAIVAKQKGALKDELEKCVEVLRLSGAKILGFILTDDTAQRKGR